MKKYLSLLFIVIPSVIFSQTASKIITEADNLYKEKSYKQAMLMLDKAKKEIETIYLSEMKSELIPTKIKGYIADNSAGMGQSFISGNVMQISQFFIGESKTGADTNKGHNEMMMPAQMIISISNLSDKAFEVLTSYSMHENSDGNDPFMASPIRFNEYRAIIQYDAGMKHGKFLAIIGGATIEIIGQNIDNKEELLTIANALELDKTINIFGK